MENEEKNLNSESSENRDQNNIQDSELQQCKRDLEKTKEAYIRLLADFENYKKRVAKDESRFAYMAQADFFLKLLPIIDDFERAFKKGVEEQSDEVKSWLSGFQMISNQLKNFLKNMGIEEVQMETFDPEIHEAISQVEVENKEPGQIIDYVEKGYKFKDQLLRAGKVAVSK